MTGHNDWLDATKALAADAEETGKLSDFYHTKVVMRFLMHTMSQETRHQLMNHHPVSYWHCVEELRG